MTAIVTKNGELINLVYGNDETVVLNTPDSCLSVNDPPETNMYYDNGWIKMPKQPSAFHVFDYDTKLWIDTRTLEEVRFATWSRIKHERIKYEYGGVTYLGCVFDSDPISQSRISAASSLGKEVFWTLKDNTSILLSAEELTGLNKAIAAHVISSHDRCQTLRLLIEKSENTEELDNLNF